MVDAAASLDVLEEQDSTFVLALCTAIICLNRGSAAPAWTSASTTVETRLDRYCMTLVFAHSTFRVACATESSKDVHLGFSIDSVEETEAQQ